MNHSFYERQVRRFLLSQIRRAMRRAQPRVVVVTGSLGKTSTRAATAHALSGTWPVYTRSLKSNFDRGPLMAFFGLRPNKNIRSLAFWLEDVRTIRTLSKTYPHEVVVLEMSEISLHNQLDLITILQPSLSILTSLANVHSSDHDAASVARQMSTLASHSQAVLYNADFPRLRKVVKGRPCITSYGVDPTADYWLKSADIDARNMSHFQVQSEDQTFDIPSRQIGQHSGVAYAAALAAVMILGGSTAKAIRGLKLLKPVRGRLNPLHGVRGSLIIDDCYNANAISMTAALDTLARFATPRIAVLGSMNELGAHSAREHRSVGTVAAHSADLLITVGEEGRRYLAPAALAAGLPAQQIHSFLSAREAGVFLLQAVKQRSTVLGKGSQDGIYVEEALLPLVLKSDRSRLVRQTRFWKAKKNAYYNNLTDHAAD